MKEHSVRLNRVGSDPEFSFVLVGPNHKPQIYPAPMLVGEDKTLRLQSLIGTDGHANTAELRPAPCHNIFWHISKIADAMQQVYKAMQYHSQKKKVLVGAVAQPSLGKEETMGGHIWISMWYNSKLAHRIIHGDNMIWDNTRKDFLCPRQGNNQVTSGPSHLQRYRDLAVDGKELTLDLCWKKLHYLLYPFEMLLFGARRGDRATVKDPWIRLPDKTTDSDLAMYRPDMAYLRWEYRPPTTWLVHPLMAQCYLGLAKFCILNWDILPRYHDLNTAVASFSYDWDDRTTWRTVFLRHWNQTINHPQVQFTRDLASLPQAVDKLVSARLKFPAYINFQAWHEFVVPRAAQEA